MSREALSSSRLGSCIRAHAHVYARAHTIRVLVRAPASVRWGRQVLAMKVCARARLKDPHTLSRDKETESPRDLLSPAPWARVPRIHFPRPIPSVKLVVVEVEETGTRTRLRYRLINARIKGIPLENTSKVPHTRGFQDKEFKKEQMWSSDFRIIAWLLPRGVSRSSFIRDSSFHKHQNTIDKRWTFYSKRAIPTRECVTLKRENSHDSILDIRLDIRLEIPNSIYAYSRDR